MPQPSGKTPSAHACNLCGGRAEAHLAGAPTIVRCADCGLLSLAEFPAPAETEACYQESYYREQSGHRFLGILEAPIRFFRWLRMRAIVRREPGPAGLLDVGCGRGVLLEMFQKRGWKVLGTQLSRTAARAATEKRGVEVFCGELTDLEAKPGSFRVVVYYHVLEHVSRPVEYLRKTRELLEAGGLCVIEVPDFSAPGFRFLGLRNFCVDYPHHLFFFTPSTLKDLVERCGLQVEAVRRFSLEYSPYTTLQNLVNLLPGSPNRLYRALMSNDEGKRLRRSPWTWLHGALALFLAAPALLLSLFSLLLPMGNTLRIYCRKRTREAACPDPGVAARLAELPKQVVLAGEAG